MLKKHASSGEFSAIARKFVWVYLSTKAKDADKYFDKYNVRAVPTIIVMTPDQNVLTRFSGYGNPLFFMDQIAKVYYGRGENFYNSKQYKEAYSVFEFVIGFGEKSEFANKSLEYMEKIEEEYPDLLPLPKDVDNKTKTESRTINTDTTTDEEKAKKLFTLGSDYEAKKCYKSAIEKFKEILEKYPKTKYAKEAKERLRKLEEAEENE